MSSSSTAREDLVQKHILASKVVLSISSVFLCLGLLGIIGPIMTPPPPPHAFMARGNSPYMRHHGDGHHAGFSEIATREDTDREHFHRRPHWNHHLPQQPRQDEFAINEVHVVERSEDVSPADEGVESSTPRFHGRRHWNQHHRHQNEGFHRDAETQIESRAGSNAKEGGRVSHRAFPRPRHAVHFLPEETKDSNVNEKLTGASPQEDNAITPHEGNHENSKYRFHGPQDRSVFPPRRFSYEDRHSHGSTGDIRGFRHHTHSGQWSRSYPSEDGQSVQSLPRQHYRQLKLPTGGYEPDTHSSALWFLHIRYVSPIVGVAVGAVGIFAGMDPTESSTHAFLLVSALAVTLLTVVCLPVELAFLCDSRESVMSALALHALATVILVPTAFSGFVLYQLTRAAAQIDAVAEDDEPIEVSSAKEVFEGIPISKNSTTPFA